MLKNKNKKKKQINYWEIGKKRRKGSFHQQVTVGKKIIKYQVI